MVSVPAMLHIHTRVQCCAVQPRNKACLLCLGRIYFIQNETEVLYSAWGTDLAACGCNISHAVVAGCKLSGKTHTCWRQLIEVGKPLYAAYACLLTYMHCIVLHQTALSLVGSMCLSSQQG
jgi:hypothetical protein